VGAALAGPEGDLLVERSRRALIQDRPDEARALAVTSLNTDREAWGAWRLYLRASRNTGLGKVAEAELAASDDPAAAVALAWWKVSTRRASIDSLRPLAEEDPRAMVALGWSLLSDDRAVEVLDLTLPEGEPLAAKLRLRALADRGRFDARDDLALSWLEAQPERPDVLAECFGRVEASKRVQRKVLKALRKRIVAGEEEPRWLLLALRTLIAADADELAEIVAERLEQAGLQRPLTRNGWGSSMRKAMGRALAGHTNIALPATTEAERADLVASLSSTLLTRGRIDEAVTVWERVRAESDSWTAALGHGRALRAAGDEEAAQRAFGEALDLTVAPWSDDPCGLNLAERAQVAGRIVDIAAKAGGDVEPLEWPSPLTSALGGDFRPWLAATDDPTMRWCLSTAVAEPIEPPPGVAVHAEVASEALHEAYDQALSLVPSELTPRGGAHLPQVGEAFPDVPLAVSEASTMADHRGTPVVLSLWASWCAPCRKELPLIDDAVEALRAEGVEVKAFGLSLDDDERAYRRALQRLPLDAIELGRDPAAGKRVGVESLPASWVIGPEGTVLLVHLGYDPELPARVAEAVRGASGATEEEE